MITDVITIQCMLSAAEWQPALAKTHTSHCLLSRSVLGYAAIPTESWPVDVIVYVVLALGVVGLIIAGPIVALVLAHSASRRAEQSQESARKLARRVETLESELKGVQGRLNAQAVVLDQVAKGVRAPEGPAAAVVAPAPVAPVAIAVGPGTPPREAAVVSSPPPELVVPPAAGAATPAPPALITPSPAPITATPAAPTVKPAEPAAAGPARLSPEPAAPRTPAVKQAPSVSTTASTPQLAMRGAEKPAAHDVAKRALHIEEALGTNWLNKLGVISVVLGVAFLLAHEMQVWGPAGRVAVGFAAGAAFLGLGWFFERRERWRILARAGLGGGWAILYLTTYAMNHFDAAHVLDSEPADFVLLIIVAAAMVAHTLRYNSRVITGLAFLLAFSTINISRAGPTSLLASAILAVALVVIVGKRRWFDMEVLAIVALFLNHYYWLRPIIEPMHGHRHSFPEFFPSAALLIFYWAIFRVSYLLRQIPAPWHGRPARELGMGETPMAPGTASAEEEEKISTVAALLNSCLFLGLMRYQAVHPEWAFRYLLALGAIEFTLGQLPITRRRRTAFVILSTIGATLAAAAFPFKYSGLSLAVLWLAEAEALFLAGVFTSEILFRWLGIAVELLVAGHMFFVDTARLGALRDARSADFSDPRRALVFALAALIIFVNTHWVPRRWPSALAKEKEWAFYRLQSYLAGFLLLAAIWAVSTEPWMAVGLAGAALALAVVGARGKIEELSVLANAFGLLAFLRVVFANFAVVEVSYVNGRAVVAILLAAGLLYAASRWVGFPAPVRTIRIPEVYTWVATFVVALLAWYQLWPASVALAWGLVGLLAFQLGFETRTASWRWQGYVLFVASFFRLFFVNFNAEETAGLLSPRLYVALPLAVLFYFVYVRLAGKPEAFLATDARWRAADLHCYLGTLVVAAAMRFELVPDWIAAAWAALVCLFVLIAWRYGRRIFVGQALLLAAAVFFRTLMHNIYERSYFPPPSAWSGGWMTGGAVVALIFGALMLARQLKEPRPEGVADGRGWLRRALAALHRRPDRVFFFVSFILLTVLLYEELQAHGMSTLAWGIEAVAVFLFALAVKERSFRLSALGLLLVSVVKIVAIDVWGLSTRDKYVTFIVLGIALYSVSYLYTRYKEVLRAYL
jgi:hypothetical protein